jgi:ketosteroid isomerase-like protein
MKSTFAAVVMALSVSLWSAVVAEADTASDVRTLYDQFRTAQNARDLATVKTLLIDSPQFLWVSDGKSFWGREALVKRMAEFQLSEVWRVDPDLEKAAIVEVNDRAAYLHMPLALTIGLKDNPEVIRFLVSILCVKQAEGWRIAALFTTAEKTN